jgi:hypothetical protein
MLPELKKRNGGKVKELGFLPTNVTEARRSVLVPRDGPAALRLPRAAICGFAMSGARRCAKRTSARP